MRVLSVFGTRPEAVKMAPVVAALANTPGVDARVCVTAQHREMLDPVLALFGIQPEYDLGLMRPDQSLAELSAAVFTHLDPVLAEYQPDWVLVQGDTTTAAISALAAYYRRIRVGHVEAGLRTGNRWQPFPEEINRRVAGVVADLHFAPTEHSRQNLLGEGVPGECIAVTGNPVIDALQAITALPTPPEVEAVLRVNRIGEHGGRRLVLVTAHRRESFGAPLEHICAALRELATRYAGRVEFVYPVHLNPNVQAPVHRLLDGIPNLLLLPPVEYLQLVHLLKRSSLVLTDSGGIQEEAPAFGVPVLVLREVTERPEGIQAGVARLVGTEQERIVSAASELLDDPRAYESMARAANPYGDGRAASRIVEALVRFDAASAGGAGR